MMMKSIKLIGTLSIAAITLVGCSSSLKIREYLPLPVETDTRDYSSMYLRGVFNWWEADAKHQLRLLESNYIVDIELIADGQPYDFKLADAVYSNEHNCGSLSSLGVLTANEAFTLHCGDAIYNLQFTPSETGTYRFTISPGVTPSITISQL